MHSSVTANIRVLHPRPRSNTPSTSFRQHQRRIQQASQIAYPKEDRSRYSTLLRQTPLFPFYSILAFFFSIYSSFSFYIYFYILVILLFMFFFIFSLSLHIPFSFHFPLLLFLLFVLVFSLLFYYFPLFSFLFLLLLCVLVFYFVLSASVQQLAYSGWGWASWSASLRVVPTQKHSKISEEPIVIVEPT